MLALHQRLAELWMLQKRRRLTAPEQNEMSQCLEANAQLAYKTAQLYHLSQIAARMNDTAWLQELGAESTSAD